MSKQPYITGTVRCHRRYRNSVSVRNDVGGDSEIPVGTYRVRLLRSFYDYETGVRCIGRLLDPADLETARRAGTTGHKPEDSLKYGREFYERTAKAAQEFDPSRVYFHMTDFRPDPVEPPPRDRINRRQRTPERP